MNKKLISLLVALCLVIGMLPIMTVAAATSATVTLWGNPVTVDTDDTTTDIPEAYYWVNGAAGELPAAATAADNWNYSFAILSGRPTVTLRNAEFGVNKQFLYGKYNGELELKYEGVNNFLKIDSVNFMTFQGTGWYQGHLYITGADENAVLNIKGNGYSNHTITAGLRLGGLTISGGTVNFEKKAYSYHQLIDANYVPTVIENCTITAKTAGTIGNNSALFCFGNSSKGVTINNSDIILDTVDPVGFAAGVWQSNGTGFASMYNLYIKGDSNIVINMSTPDSALTGTYKDAVWMGAGIYAAKVIIEDGELEINAPNQAISVTDASAAPDLSTYDGAYKMYTAKDGAAVSAYAAAPYFKLEKDTTPVTETSAPTVETSAPTVETSAPTEQTTAPTQTTAPVGGDLAQAYAVKIDGVELKVTKYDTPVYSVNTTKTGYFNTVVSGAVTDSVAKDHIGQSKTDADESNYNAKLVWHSSDETPTLYLKDLIVDNYDEDLAKWRFGSAADKYTLTNAAVFTGDTAPLRIVLQGGESSFQTYNGIHYQKDLSIESEGDASLKLWTARNGIIPSKAANGYANNNTHLSGSKLTLNANLTVSMGSFTNSDNSGYIIRTKGADMIINGGNIVAEYRGAAKNVQGIGVLDSGNLYVNGGSIYAQSYDTDNYTSAAYQVAGDIYVTGGTLKAYSKSQSGVRASNIYITGGKVESEGKYGALVVNSANGELSITGGIVEGIAVRPFAYNNSNTSNAVKIPTLGANAVVTAGASKDAAEQVADAETFAFNTKYIKVDYTAPAPTSGTTAPTGGTTAPTDGTTPGQTTAPTSGTTPSQTTAPAGADLTQAYFVQIDGLELKVTKYDAPVYAKNATKTGCYNTVSGDAVTDSVTKDYAGQTKTDADESNYNAKLVWHAGDSCPTLYLKGLVVDNYDEELKKWRYPSASGKYYIANAAIFTGDTAPLKIVVESDSSFQTVNGIHYQKDLTIESVGEAKLTLWTSRNGIIPSKVASGYANNNTHLSGSKLTLNANLTVSLGGFSNFDNSGYIIRTKGADMIINGGNIITEFRENVARGVQAIGVLDSGNLYVNGGYIYGASYDTINFTSAAYQIAGDVFVTGGTLEAESANQSGIRATNITVTGGKVIANAGAGGLVINNDTGKITITGGIVEAKADKPFAYNNGAKSQAILIPVLGDVLPVVKAGSALKTAEYIDDVANFKFDERYTHIDYVVDPNAPRPTVDPNAPTEPIEPGSELDDAITITLGDTVGLKITHYDTPVYSMNVATEKEDFTGKLFTRYTQTTNGANEENYNAKLIWNSTDPTPTLTLRGFKLDDWNNETSQWAANPNNTGKGYFQTYSIVTNKKAPLTILLTGEDSLIECYFGITYHSDLTIKSEGNTKLTIAGYASAITPNTTAGNKLTIDANLDLSVQSLYNQEFSAGCITNYDGDIVIDGGTIKCKPLDVWGKNYSLQAIVARKGGNIIINGGNITGSSTGGAGHKNGAIQTQDKLIINGGTVNVNPGKAVALYGGKGIEVNGGNVKVVGPWYAVTSGTDKEGTPIVFNGGTTTIMAERSFYDGKLLQFGDGVMAYCGAGKKNAEIYDGSDPKLALKPWFFITNDPEQFIEIEEEEEDDSDLPIFTVPTKAPTQATQAPTDTTQAPADETVAPTDATVAPEATEAPGATDATTAPEAESNTKIELNEGLAAEVPQALVDLGYNSAEEILQSMVESLWAVEENINRVSFFDAVLKYKEGEEWIKADETHFPADGWLQVLLPYPEGTDMNTQFIGLHMFTSAAFGKTPGDVELLIPVCTEEGILVEVTGLSPILLGWYADETAEGDSDQGLLPEEPENPATGDTGAAMLAALMLVAVLGMAAVVITDKKRVCRK